MKTSTQRLFAVIAVMAIIGAGCVLQKDDQAKSIVDPAPAATSTAVIPTAETDPVVPTLPVICIDKQDGAPAITSLSHYSGSIGTTLTVAGCNFSGFEGDESVWIENSLGVKGLLSGEAGSTSKLIKVTLTSPLCQKDTSYSGLPCDAPLVLTPGTYKIYATAWTQKSNEVPFTIK